MLKKYSSKTQISINVRLESGKSLHVAFSPITGGSSLYYTEDENVQMALEKHYHYGTLFTGSVVEHVEPKKTAEPKDKDAKSSMKEITVSCADDAKDYLSDRFGVSRTKMRSVKAIQESAHAFGVVFKGLE